MSEKKETFKRLYDHRDRAHVQQRTRKSGRKEKIIYLSGQKKIDYC